MVLYTSQYSSQTVAPLKGGPTPTVWGIQSPLVGFPAGPIPALVLYLMQCQDPNHPGW